MLPALMPSQSIQSVVTKLVPTALVGVSIIAAAAILGKASIAVFNIKQAEKRVVVTGSATKRIRSDLVVWRATIKSQASEMAVSYRKLASDVPTVVEFLKNHGIDPKEIKVSSTSVGELHARDKEGREFPEQTVAFVTEQRIEVSSTEIEKVERVSRESTELIDRGIYITSEEPLYIYTKLAELKVKMVAEASRDARNRAEQMAEQAKTKITSLITSRMGVMQINPAYETSVSGEGNNDRSSLEKDVLAVTTATYGIE
jgi:hypothetical protein